MILHELAHACHDQKLDFDAPRIKAAHERFKQSGHGDAALPCNGMRVKHYGMTDQKEFFAEMTESYAASTTSSPSTARSFSKLNPNCFNSSRRSGTRRKHNRRKRDFS